MSINLKEMPLDRNNPKPMPMKNLKYSVGIDVSKKDFKACISVIDEQQRVTVKATSAFDNTPKGFGLFLQWAVKHRKEDLDIRFLVEATGVYHEQLAWYLHRNGMKVTVLLPNKAKRYIQSLGLKSKNDRIDAAGLAQMCSQQHLREWRPISKNIYALRGLTRLYEDLSAQKNSCSNRIEGLGHAMHELKVAEKSLSRIVKALDTEMGRVLSQIRKTVEGDALLASKFEKIARIKGVGLLAFAVIVAETDGFELFDSASQLTSYAGYDVAENQSGGRAGKARMSKKGNSHIRRVLHLPAFSAVKHEPVFRQFYDRVYGNTHVKMKAYVAVQRKLLCLMYSLWKKDQAFDPNIGAIKHSEGGTVDPLWVDSGGTTKKPSPKALASLDEHSSALTVSPLWVCKNK